jgi:hypothetical protein
LFAQSVAPSETPAALPGPRNRARYAALEQFLGNRVRFRVGLCRRLPVGRGGSGMLPPRYSNPGIAVACILPLIFSVLCCAQQAPITYPVDGVVENSITHQPVARALVESNQDSVLTDSEGRFELQLRAGLAHLIVRRPGYLGMTPGQPPAQRNIEVSEHTPPLTLLITPAASIAGHVTLSSADQAAGTQLMLFRKQLDQGRARWVSAGNAMTDSDGTFRFPVVAAPGSYVVCTQSSLERDLFPAPGAAALGFPAACFPGGLDLASAIAAPLAVAPGQQAQVEIALTRQTFYPVSISVNGSKSGPSNSVQVFDRSGRAAMASMVLDQRTGAWQFLLPNGRYYAESRVWGDTPLYGRLDFTVAGAPLSGLSLVAAPVAPIPVIVRKEFTASPEQDSGGPVNFRGQVSLDGRATWLGDQPPVEISVTPIDRPLDGEMGINLRPESGSTDTFLLDAPPQGAYTVNVQGSDPHAYAASVTSGSTDLLRDPLVIGPGGSVQPIEITLRNDMGFLHCTVKSDAASDAGEGAAPSWPIPVDAIPAGSSPQRIYFTAAQTGSREIGAFPLPPGSYLILALEDPREIDLDDADLMSRLAPLGQTVNIQPGATLELEVSPIPGDEAGSR